MKVEIEVYGVTYEDVVKTALEKARDYWPEENDHLTVEPFTAYPATDKAPNVPKWRAVVTVVNMRLHEEYGGWGGFCG